MDWKKLVLVCIVASVLSALLLILNALLSGFISEILKDDQEVPVFLFLSLVILQIIGGAILYMVITKLLKFQFGETNMQLFLSILKVWAVSALIFVITYFLLFQAELEERSAHYEDCKATLAAAYKRGGPVPMIHCGSEPRMMFFSLPLLLLPNNPVTFFIGAYLARKVLKW